MFWQGVRLFLCLALLTGIAYPLIITGIAYMIFPGKAGGSLIMAKGHIAGSALIAQKFTSDRYFWPRPSAVDYNPLRSGGSNLGPTSAVLKRKVEERRRMLRQKHGVADGTPIPSVLLYASGSGLDPHITRRAAYFQVDRIAKARGWGEEEKKKINDLIHSLDKRASINVLILNQALDELK